MTSELGVAQNSVRRHDGRAPRRLYSVCGCLPPVTPFAAGSESVAFSVTTTGQPRRCRPIQEVGHNGLANGIQKVYTPDHAASAYS